MAECGCEIEITSKEDRRVLIVLLAINLAMFLVEIAIGNVLTLLCEKFTETTRSYFYKTQAI